MILDAGIGTVASSPPVALIGRVASPDNTKYDEKAEGP